MRPLTTVEEAEGRALVELGAGAFMDTSFRPALTRYLDSTAEVDLRSLARGAGAREVHRVLVNRLLRESYERTHPTLYEERLDSPLFIVSLPRTGTTLLHRLLGRDPANRVLRFWEGYLPVGDEADADHVEKRKEESAAAVSRLNRLIPRLPVVHELRWDAAEECSNLLEHEFASNVLSMTWGGRSYTEWLFGVDMTPQYRSHRKWLQLIQHQSHARGRWVLKAPEHLRGLDAIVRVFPGARFVWIARDMRSVVGSTCSLVATVRRAFVRNLDLADIGRECREALEALGERMIAFQRTSSECVYVVSYDDLVKDPLAVAAQLYEWLDWDGATLRNPAVVEFADQACRRDAPLHDYDLERFGLSAESIRLSDTIRALELGAWIGTA